MPYDSREDIDLDPWREAMEGWDYELGPCPDCGAPEGECDRDDSCKHTCEGCEAVGRYYEGLCYQCQCDHHAMGVYDMDGDGWRVR